MKYDLEMSNSDQDSVGIVSTGMYLPERVVTAVDITKERYRGTGDSRKIRDRRRGRRRLCLGCDLWLVGIS